MDRMQGWADSAMKPAQPVVLVHGLWMPPGAMALLAHRIRAQHFAPHSFAYRGREPLRQNVQALTRYLRELGGAPHLVAHSFGGVLVLEMLSRYPELEVSSAVLLGSPVLGSICGRRLGTHRLGRWLLGDTCSLWGERPRLEWTHRAALGVIAGGAPWGLGRLLGPLPFPNDGVVCVHETLVEGMADRIVLEVNHSGMPFSREVARQVVAFLRWRRFNPA